MAGLVAACRYAGLLDASRVAHSKAVSLDAEVRTTVCWTFFNLGEYAAAIQADTGTPAFCSMLSRLIAGEISATDLKAVEDATPEGVPRTAVRVYRQFAEGQLGPAIADLERLAVMGFADPEAWFLGGVFAARGGGTNEAIALLTRAVEGGSACHRALVEREHFDRLRGSTDFAQLLERARERFEHARRLYELAGGPAVLGPAS